MLRILLISVLWLSLGTAAQAQAVCATVIDLSRMFTVIEMVIDQRGAATTGQLADLSAINLRHDAFSVNYNISNSPLTHQRATINNAFERADIIRRELQTQGTQSSTATLPSTAASFNRALAVLGRMDCPPPVGGPTDQGAKTSLPRSAESVTTGLGIGVIAKLKWPAIFMGTLIAAGLFGLALNMYYKRSVSLVQRFDCNVETSFILPGSPPVLGSGRIVDISRTGMKVSVAEPFSPKKGDRVILSINDDDYPMQVRWQNAFYFGGVFKKSLSARAVKKLTGANLKKSQRKQQSDRKEADRNQAH